MNREFMMCHRSQESCLTKILICFCSGYHTTCGSTLNSFNKQICFIDQGVKCAEHEFLVGRCGTISCFVCYLVKQRVVQHVFTTHISLRYIGCTERISPHRAT